MNWKEHSISQTKSPALQTISISCPIFGKVCAFHIDAVSHLQTLKTKLKQVILDLEELARMLSLKPTLNKKGSLI